MQTATIYAGNIGEWHKIATYTLPIAIAVLNDPEYKKNLENMGFSKSATIAAVNDQTGEIIK